MIRELIGSYLNFDERGGEPSQNDPRHKAVTVPMPVVSADIIREGFERLEEEYGTSAEEVVDAAAAEAVGGDRTLEQELAYGDYAEKIQSMYPECKCIKTTFYTARRPFSRDVLFSYHLEVPVTSRAAQ